MNRIVTIILFTLASILLFSTLSDAQATRWQKKFDMGEDEPVGSVTPTPDGGYIMTGSTGQSIYADIFVIKTDQEGELQWSEVYDLPNMTTGGKQIRNTPDGGYMVFASNNAGETNIILLKIDAFGTIEWYQNYVDEATLGSIGDLVVTSDGGYAFLSSKYNLDPVTGDFIDRQNFLYRLDNMGNILWIHESGTISSDFANSLVENPDGSFVFTGSYVDTDSGWIYNNYLTKVDGDGNLLWTQYYNNLSSNSSEGASHVLRTDDGGYFITGEARISGIRSIYVIRTDADGNIVWTEQLYSETTVAYGTSSVQTSDGNFVIFGRRGYDNSVVVKLSDTGNLLWERTINGLSAGLSIYETMDVGLIVCGEWNAQVIDGYPDEEVALIKMDGNGLFLPKAIVGNVYADFDTNCTLTPGDEGLEDILVQVDGSSGQTFFTSTDSVGNYFMSLDTGAYTVRAYPPSPFYESCQDSYVVALVNPLVFDSLELDIPLEVTAFCPYLEVDVSSWALRECFDNYYYVNYCNLGTIPATDAYVELSLQGALSISAASIPFTGPDSNNVYTFDVGTVGVGDCSAFNVTVQLPCDTTNVGQFFGKTLCVDAHIYPDSICGPISDLWDGSSIEVTGECDQDSVRFKIRNIGIGDMQSDRSFYVIEDQIMFMQGTFQLVSGESSEMAFFADGSTYRLEAEQAEDHPGMSNPSVALEGCGDMLPFSLGFINQFDQDDRDPFISSECQEVTASYDPNDKQGFPVGYAEEHYIERNTEIEYLVRFQNTGNDTAFTVVIRDMISEDLDLSTFRAGASSHPYDVEVIDRMVKFTFNDIFLVDSLTNEPASHGFIKFKISQNLDLPLGTVIENTAGTYFDFNPAIITNTTFHTIGENFVTIDIVSDVDDIIELSSIKAYPNPFDEVINFEVEGVFEEIILSVYDVNGRQVHLKQYNTSLFQFNANHLNSGVYFYTLSSKGEKFASGKMMLK